MVKKLVLLTTLVFFGNLFAETKTTPPALGTDSLGQKNECKVPEFLVNIPPQMEDDYTSCVNDRYKPSKALVDVVLKQQVNKDAVIVSIQPAPRFYTRVYKIVYKVGKKEKSIICNDKMTYCVEDKPIASRER